MAAKATIQNIAVIGGGVAGLLAARALRKYGFQTVIYEKADDVSGVWRSNYDQYAVQVPKTLYEFPDYPAPYPDYADGAAVKSYIKSYAKQHGLLDPAVLKLATAVQSLKPREDGLAGWTITAKSADGTVTNKAYDFVVMATGLYSTPNKPSFPGQETFQGKILHSTEFLDAKAVCQDKDVVVLGAAKSAIDCAVVSAEKGAKSTTLLFRQPHWGTPRKIAGLIPFQYVFLSRFGQGLVSWYKGAWPTAPANVHAVHRALAPALGPVFKIVESLFAFQLGQKGEYRPQTSVLTDFYSAAHVLNSDLKNAISKGKIAAKQGSISKLTPKGLVLSNGKEVPADVLVLGTGFKRDYSSIFAPATVKALNVESDGLWLYRSILPVDVPRLAFIGSEVATISNIGTHGVQSEWLARALAGKLALPSRQEMIDEIEAHKKFSRGWMPETNARSALVLLHQTHYHDQLCKDMGEPHRRKGANVVAELFAPYAPADYASVVAARPK